MDDRGERVVLVSGGGRDAGAAICSELAVFGATLSVADENAASARETVSRLRSIGGRAIAVHADIADERSIEAAVERTLSQFGRLDAIVNNVCSEHPGRLEDLAVDEWDRVLARSLRGPFLFAKYAVPALKRNSGKIVNVMCSWSLGGDQRAIARQAGTWGLLGLSQALQAELRPYKVEVRTIVDGRECGAPTVGECANEPLDAVEGEFERDPLQIAVAVRRVLFRSSPPAASAPMSHDESALAA